MYGLTMGMLGTTPVPLLLLLLVVVDTTELLGSEDDELDTLLLFVLLLETVLDETLSNCVETGVSFSFELLKLLYCPEEVLVLPEYPVLLFRPVFPYTFCELF